VIVGSLMEGLLNNSVGFSENCEELFTSMLENNCVVVV